ncbi:MAG TPA: PilZ domain-containing protein [Terriglobales bacterium]|nr:PilZ domain-containing protein [Terriglobales bacterium]
MAATRTSSRRRAERIPASGPATIRCQGNSLDATVRDVSLGGVFLFTDANFHAGAEIQVVLMLPRELGLDATQMICCHGKIVRVEKHEGRYGVAAQIEKMEGLPQI